MTSSRLPARRQDQAADWQSQCGPLEPFLRDPSVTEIMVNGPAKIFVEQGGLLKKTAAKFDSAEELMRLMVAMAGSIGRTLDPQHPTADGRLPDGSRINCVLPPVAVDGPALTIRKFSLFALTHTQLVAAGAMDERLAYFLNRCVTARLNVVVSGGTGSGKTTLLNVLSSFIGAGERIVSIEDSAELKIRVDNLVRMEARPPSAGDPGVSIRQLVINALRMRPDRIIVGECRGPEALDMLVAMNTGHEGSMTTIHANSARDALRRMETMVMLAGTEIPLKVVRSNISSAIHLIVQVARGADGVRRLTEVVEIGNMEGEVILTQDIFKYHPQLGFKTQGIVPQFVRIFRERGVDFPADFFAEGYAVRGGGGGPKRG